MNFDFFLGIDVSKQSLDFALLNAEGKLLMQLQTENSLTAIKDLLDKLPAVDPQKLLICLEHIGIYNYPLLDTFANATYSVWLESGKQIRYSMGVQRAKTDAIDALNIARYAFKNQRECRLWKPESKLLTQLKALAGLRSRLIAAQTQLSLPQKEAKAFADKQVMKTLEKAMTASLKALDKDL